MTVNALNISFGKVKGACLAETLKGTAGLPLPRYRAVPQQLVLFASRHSLCKSKVYPTFALTSQPGINLTSGPDREETCLSGLEAGASGASIATR